MQINTVSRRNFVTAGAVAATGLAATAGAALAHATENDGAATGTDYDVVVVGSGLAGLAAGLKLLDLGVKRVAIVTKGDGAGVGANSFISGGTFNFPKDDSQEAIEEFMEVYRGKSSGYGREDLTRLIGENIRSGLDWLRGHGCEFTEETQVAPFELLQVNAWPGSGQGMPALVQTLADEFEAAGGVILSNTKLLDFELDGMGAVCGVKVRGEEGIAVISATSTVVATGGWAANKQLLEQYIGPDGDQILMRGSKVITGDGIVAAQRIGAIMYQAGGLEQTMHLAAVSPENPAMCNPYQALAQTVAVNNNGQRYVDESRGYVANAKAVFNQPDQTCALVFDSATAEITTVKADMDKFANFGQEVVSADTIEELAEKIGVDPAAFKTTIDEFNAASDGEKTTGLAIEKAAAANKVETAPFYAFWPLKPGTIMCFGGLYTDGDCRVLEADGTPIKNLYAAGEIIGGVFQYDYLGGASLDRAVTTGIHVAELIAESL